MSNGRTLSFSQWLGGSQNLKMLEMLSDHQSAFTYDFPGDITNYDFTANYSTLVVDQMTYNVTTGEPNFATSVVKGYLGNPNTVIPVSNIVVTDAANGLVNFTIPKDRYIGWIYPDARTNVVISIVEFQWENQGVTPYVIDSHRWAIIERYTSDVVAGNPTSGSNTVTFTDITGA